MARAFGVSKIKMLLLREGKQVESAYKKVAGKEYKRETKKEEEKETTSYWVPHPKTGIYFPEGHERVMVDVPENAASLTNTYWLRNVDGVDI